MRKALIDKCEDIINEQSLTLGEQGLQTSKLFKDLVTFYKSVDKSIYSNTSDTKNFMSSPGGTHTTSFMPAISQNTFPEASLAEEQPKLQTPTQFKIETQQESYNSSMNTRRKQSVPAQSRPGHFTPMIKI